MHGSNFNDFGVSEFFGLTVNSVLTESESDSLCRNWYCFLGGSGALSWARPSEADMFSDVKSGCYFTVMA